MTKKSGGISRALRQKGFAEDRKRDHVFYFFIYQGKKTQIYTKISHSASEIAPHLFGMMARDHITPPRPRE